MLQQIIDQAPRFFGYYNVLFLLQAFAATFLLSLAGCVLGFALGFACVAFAVGVAGRRDVAVRHGVAVAVGVAGRLDVAVRVGVAVCFGARE